jgi:hypothetical protein
VRLRIHKVLERGVSSLLELHVVFETLIEHLVHLCLELKQLLSEQDRVSETLFIFHDFFTALLDVRNHLFDHQS